MGNCPVGTLGDEEDEVIMKTEGGWTTVNENSSSFQKNYAVAEDDQLWPDGIIPYVIHNSLDFNRSRIQAAMKTIEKNSRFRFVRRSHHQKHFLTISRQDGCYFTKEDWDRPRISIGIRCETYDSILHELLHALGFPHEKRRPDRDDYVTIYWKNIQKGNVPQYKRLRYDEYKWIDLPFDYDSIMLYESYAFSKNDKRTMETEDGREIRRNTKLSNIDKEKLRRL